MKKILSGLFLLAAVFTFNSGDASAATRTWDGGGSTNNITDAANWDGDIAVVDGDSLSIDAENHPTGGSVTLNNDTAFTFVGLTLSTADTTLNGITLTGNTYNVSGGVNVSYGLSSNEIPGSIVFNADVNFTSNVTITSINTTPGILTFNNPVSSSSTLGFIGFNSTVIFRASNPGLDQLNITNGTVRLDLTPANQATILGSPSTATTLAGGVLQVCPAAGTSGSSRTLSENINVLAASTITSAQVDASYCTSLDSYDTLELDGTITMVNDLTFDMTSKWARVLLTGTISGAHQISAIGAVAVLEISAATNNSLTGNGIYRVGVVDTAIGDGDVLTIPFYVANTEVVTYSKTAGTDNLIVLSGATLKGSGVTTGTLRVDSGASLAPGNSPGCLSVGNTVLAGSFDIELGGTTVCTEYDQLTVTGTVDLTGSTLNTSRYNNFEPALSNTFTILDNDGSDAITGTFAGLAEGATFSLNGYTFQISYVGGDGNDVTLTVTAVAPNAPTTAPQSNPAAPSTPNTGLAMLMNSPLQTLLATTLLAGTLVAIGRKYGVISRL